MVPSVLILDFYEKIQQKKDPEMVSIYVFFGQWKKAAVTSPQFIEND